MKTSRILNKNLNLTIGKIVCVGQNYLDHITELKSAVPEKPVIFLKPASAVIYNNGTIIKPSFANLLHYETELILLIGKTIKHASIEEAEEAIIAYGVGIDATMRDEQNYLKAKGLPWTTSKCFDTSAVISDFISAEDYPLTLHEKIELRVNGKVRQSEKLDKMIHSPVELVQFISTRLTLEEGDIVFTGTPAGVGELFNNDTLEASIENIAALKCFVAVE